MRFDPEKHHRRSIRLKGYDKGDKERISSPFARMIGCACLARWWEAK
jgi:hypothetical protein